MTLEEWQAAHAETKAELEALSTSGRIVRDYAGPLTGYIYSVRELHAHEYQVCSWDGRCWEPSIHTTYLQRRDAQLALDAHANKHGFEEVT